MEYPTDIKIYLDNVDITFNIFGVDYFTPTETNFFFVDVDLSTFIGVAGMHKIKIVAGGGTGRVDCRVEIA